VTNGNLILVPLTSVLYVLAIASFLTSAYYGFRVSRITNKVKITVMMTQDGPISVSRGIMILALSLMLKLIEMFTPSTYYNSLELSSAILLLGSSLIFAVGFEKIFSAYHNERIRANVYSTLEELRESEIEQEDKNEWNKRAR
jgi:hypothetical protein